jgi:DeoR family transcriptional regulator of aga operon
LFLSVDGIAAAYGITTPNVEEAHLIQIMIEISKKVIVVTDSSKFNNRGFAYIAPVSIIDTLITDLKIPDNECSTLKNMGIDVVLV